MSLPKAAAYITAITGFRSAAAGPNSKALSDDDGAIQLSVNEPTDFVHGSCAVQVRAERETAPRRAASNAAGVCKAPAAPPTARTIQRAQRVATHAPPYPDHKPP